MPSHRTGDDMPGEDTKRDSATAGAGSFAAQHATPTATWTCERQDDDYGEIYWAIHDAQTYDFIANVHSSETHAALITAAPATAEAASAMLAALKATRYALTVWPKVTSTERALASVDAAIAQAAAAGIGSAT